MFCSYLLDIKKIEKYLDLEGKEMKNKKILNLVYVILLGIQFSACTRVENSSNPKLSNEINHVWKVIDANPKSNMDVSDFGEEDGTIYFEDNKLYGGLKVSRGYEKFKKTHSTVNENDFKDLKQFNMALKKNRLQSKRYE